MIESQAVVALWEQLGQIEERLGRLLASGWRQARPEAAALRQEGEALADAGLPELAARIMAVAEAQDATAGLRAIALATSACRQLRLRLPVQGMPADWAPLMPGKPSNRRQTQALVPIARLLLEEREVWACARPNRNELLLVDPPFPDEAPADAGDVTSVHAAQTGGIFRRLRRQLGTALGGAGSDRGPSHWLRNRLAGTLRWQTRYPVGVAADVGHFTLEGSAWMTEHDDQNTVLAFHRLIGGEKLQDDAPVFWTSGGFRVKLLERGDPASYVWLDPSAAEVFGRASAERVWGIVWLAGAAIVPVALLTPRERDRPPRLTHLIPGAPEDVLLAAP